jgi:phosphatidylserine/phosphatidylglycerophosphate/cardiolipin synthase-like enzyme
VLVTVILDKISPRQKGEGADPVHNAGIPTFIERKRKTAHNKTVVVDQTTVVTGSFNFSTIPGCCNADHLLVIHRPALAVAYAENFARRRAVRAGGRSGSSTLRSPAGLGLGSAPHHSVLVEICGDIGH